MVLGKLADVLRTLQTSKDKTVSVAVKLAEAKEKCSAEKDDGGREPGKSEEHYKEHLVGTIVPSKLYEVEVGSWS